MPRYQLVVLITLWVFCVVTSITRASPVPCEWMLDAFANCVEAQITIDNPMIDSQSGRVDDDRLDNYVVEFMTYKNIPFYYIVVHQVSPYPGSAGFLCRLHDSTDVVYYALYYEGEPGSEKNRQKSFFEHDTTAGLSESEINKLPEEVDVIKFLLNDMVGH